MFLFLGWLLFLVFRIYIYIYSSLHEEVFHQKGDEEGEGGESAD